MPTFDRFNLKSVSLLWGLPLSHIAFVVLGCCSAIAFAEPVEPEQSVTVNLLELPSSRQAQAILNSESRFLWEQTPLRLGLQDLSQIHGISIWIDRGLDPMQSVTTPAANGDSTLLERLRQIATLINAEVGLIENVVYFGSAGQVAPLQRAAVELHDAISRVASERSAQLRPWNWQELSTSTEMLAQLAAQWKINIVGDLPHDLYHAGELVQPATVATQLTLLVGGFDRQAVLTASGRFELKPLDGRSRWQAKYRKSDLDLKSLAILKSEYSNSQCFTRGEVSQVVGVTDFHLALLASPTARPAARMIESSQAWEFKVQHTPLEDVLIKLSGSFGFELKWDVTCTEEMRQQRISFEVEGVTTDELLAEVARVSRLKIMRDKKFLVVKP